MIRLFKKMGSMVMKTKSSPYYNHEGYSDPTAYHALKNIGKEETEIEKQVSELVRVFKAICSLSGFDVVGRIQLRHKKTGRRFD